MDIRLLDFLGKRVRIVDVNDKIWIGKATIYNPEDDFGDGEEESIDVRVDTVHNALIEFEKTDIKTIEIIE